MTTIRCAHCGGSGKEVESTSLTTGVAKYRACGVCNGTGIVPRDKSHFTTYPDKSLQYARELMQRLGKPTEIRIVANNNFNIKFKNGEAYILGGLTVGYRGTGPRYSKELLDAAGFEVTLDEIEEMKPPINLISKHSVPKDVPIRSEAKTPTPRDPAEATEAKKQHKSIEIEASSLDAVRVLAQTKLESLTAAERWTLKETVIQAGSVKRVRYSGETLESARALEQNRRPPWATIQEQQILMEPLTDVLEIDAHDRNEAITLAQKQEIDGRQITDVKVLSPPKRGFFGIGSTPGKYSITILRLAVLEVIYCGRAKIRFSWTEVDYKDNTERNDNQIEDVSIENGFMWQKKCDGIERTYDDACVYCRSLRLQGHSDWRLPSLSEFWTLAKNLEPKYADYWTSTEEPRLTTNVAYINDGATMFKTNKYFVRAVRRLVLEPADEKLENATETAFEGALDAAFGLGAAQSPVVVETPSYRMRKGDAVRYCGAGSRDVGEEGTVMEVYADGKCKVKWDSDGTIDSYDDAFLHKEAERRSGG